MLKAGALPFVPGQVHRKLAVHVDAPTGRRRWSYGFRDGTTLQALVIAAENGSVEGVPAFNVGYAVAEHFRRQGLARRALGMAIDELRWGFARHAPAIAVEAVVGVDNAASIRVAESVLGGPGKPLTDSGSGLPALHFLRVFTTGTGHR